jgi:hypothetical protein
MLRESKEENEEVPYNKQKRETIKVTVNVK